MVAIRAIMNRPYEKAPSGEVRYVTYGKKILNAFETGIAENGAQSARRERGVAPYIKKHQGWQRGYEVKNQ